MRVRVRSLPEQEVLQPLGHAQGDVSEGVVFVASRSLADWPAVEDELCEAFDLAQQASAQDAPVVFVVDSDAMLGRAPVLDSMVATGLVSGARALAFEGLRKERYVGLVATDGTAAGTSLAETIRFAVSTRAGHGQVITLGTGHAGGMFP